MDNTKEAKGTPFSPVGKDAIKDLFSFLAEIEDPVKDANNPFFKSKYAPLNSVLPEIKKVALKHNYRVMQKITGDSGEVSCETVLLHSSGEFFSSGILSMQIMSDKSGQVTPQGLGSTVTYLRRYQAYPFFGIAEMDDDGNAGSGRDEDKSMGNEKKAPAKTSKPAEEKNDFADSMMKLDFYEAEINKAKSIEDLNAVWEDVKVDSDVDEDGVNILIVAVKKKKKELKK